MASTQQNKTVDQAHSDAGTLRWLGIGGGIALVLAALALLLAWQHASDQRRAEADVKARVAAEMNRIEAEAARMDREAAR